MPKGVIRSRASKDRKHSSYNRTNIQRLKKITTQKTKDRARRTPLKSGGELITGYATRLTRLVSLVERELITLPEHLRLLSGFSGIRIAKSVALYEYFVDGCSSFFCWPLCCLFVFDLRISITPLASPNSS